MIWRTSIDNGLKVWEIPTGNSSYCWSLTDYQWTLYLPLISKSNPHQNIWCELGAWAEFHRWNCHRSLYPRSMLDETPRKHQSKSFSCIAWQFWASSVRWRSSISPDTVQNCCTPAIQKNYTWPDGYCSLIWLLAWTKLSLHIYYFVFLLQDQGHFFLRNSWVKAG